MAARANLIALSMASAPELVKKTRSMPGVGPLDQLLGQEPGQERAVHLHEVGQVGVERVVERLDDAGWPRPEGEDPEAGEEVEVALPFVVDEVAALAPLEEAVELDGAEDTRQLRVDVLRVEA